VNSGENFWQRPSWRRHLSSLGRAVGGHTLVAAALLGLLLALCCSATAAFLDTWSAAGQSVDVVGLAERRAARPKGHTDVQLDPSRSLVGPRAAGGAMGSSAPVLAGLPTMRDAYVHFPLLLPALLTLCGCGALACYFMVERKSAYWVMVLDNFAAFAISNCWNFATCILLPFAVQGTYLVVVNSVLIAKLRDGARTPAAPKKEKSAELVHVVVIPACKEPWTVLRRTVASLARQQGVPKRRRCLLMAFEAVDPHAKDMFAQLKETFAADFGHMWCTVHVLQKGEEAGKAANETFAVKWLYSELSKTHNPDNVMITICDADSDFPPHHLDQVEAAYFDEPGNNVVYAGVLNTWGNYLDTWNPLIKTFEMKRVCMRLVTMWLPMPPFHTKIESNYSLTLGLAHRIDYWTHDVMQEDTHTQHKVMLLLRNGVPVVPIYSMICNDLVTGFCERYSQAKRHAWAITQIAWVLTLLGRVEFKVFLHHIYEAVYRQFLVKFIAVWWTAPLFLAPIRHVFLALTRQAQLTTLGMVLGFMVMQWISDTVMLGFLWYGLLAKRTSVPKPSMLSFIAMRLLAWPLGFVSDIVFLFLPMWHCAVHALFSPRFEYVTAPKGVKSWGGAAPNPPVKDFLPPLPPVVERRTGDCGRLRQSPWYRTAVK